MRAIIILFLTLIGTQAISQKHKFVIYTLGGADLYVNGELRRRNIEKKESISFSFSNETPDAYVLELKQKGFEDKTFRYSTIGLKESTKVFHSMKYLRHRLDTVSDLTFEFTKLKYDIPNNPAIGIISGNMNTYGVPIHWNDLEKNESDLSQINVEIQNELKITGFNVLQPVEEGNLFEESKQEINKEADILIGAVVKEFFIKGYNPVRSKNLKVKMKIEWQFYNNTTGEFIGSKTTHKESFMIDFTANLNLGVNLSFGENFAEVLRSPEILNLILQVDSEATRKYKEAVLKEYSFINSPSPSFNTYGEMIKAVNPSVVTIKGDKGHGSGFVISKEGYILTNYHVVDNNYNISVAFQNGIEMPFEILNYSEEFDLALLKVVGKGYSSIRLSKNNSELGDDVIAIGTPMTTDLTNTISKGIVSGFRSVDAEQSLIQTDVSVSPGNSGGPLINDKGEVVGIVAKKIVDFGVEGIAFAIPIQDALKVLKITLK